MDAFSATGLRTTVTKDQFEKAQAFLLQKLQQELPAYLTYHNAAHTEGVMKATAHLCQREGVPEEDRWLLMTAALFHDAGFLRTYDNHEEMSCDVAWETLPAYGYRNESIEAVCRLIMVTKLPQAPTSHYEEIICDADLYYLGTVEFAVIAGQLYKEWQAAGHVQSEEEWKARQLRFLQHHRYFTATARAEMDPKKKAHIRALREKARRLKQKDYISDNTRENVNDIVWMVLGVVVSGFALKSFLVPHHFFDGGVTGISLLLHELYDYNLALTIILANLPLIAASYFLVSKRFSYKTLLCVVLFGVCLQFVPYPAVPEAERILLALFGGFFLGVGVGFCMRGGCALDGVEVLALKTFKRTPFTVTEIILAINVLIFCVAAFKLGILTALYSIVTYFTASRCIDYVVEGIEAYTGVTIISSESELVKYRLVNELGRGITIYKGERGFLPGQFETSADCDIIFTVVTRLELRRLKNLVHETDPKAFVIANTIREASGGILRRRAAH
jgi:uncharacterized membrane-anchored protein YitT (DUF2179 family)/predicted metal-dependent HD superfamily phosphohydrolase